MPDKDNFGAVLQPVGYRWQNDRDGLVEDGTAPACRASAGSSGFHEMNHPVVVQQPVPFTKAKRAQSTTDDETWVDGKVNPTLSLFDQGDTRATTVAVAFTPGNLSRGAGPSPNAEVAPTQRCSAGRGADDQRTCVAMVGTDLYNGAITGDVAATMGTPGSSVNASGPTVMAFPIDTQNMTEGHASGGLGFGQHGDPSFTVTKGHSHAVAFSSNMSVPDCQTDGTTPTMKCGGQGPTGNPPAVAHALRGEGFDASEDGTGRGTPLVPIAPTLTAHNDPSRSPQSSEVTQQVAAVHAASMTVRRLTARECERLQAFPDDWTLIPWRGKPAEQCPDGPRYKALGNSMAVNCMAWIGERIAAAEASHA